MLLALYALDLGAGPTTVGVLGVFDVASSLGVEQKRADFGLTLGRWLFAMFSVR